MLELHASKWRPCSSEGRGCWQQHLLTRLLTPQHQGSCRLPNLDAAEKKRSLRCRDSYRSSNVMQSIVCESTRTLSVLHLRRARSPSERSLFLPMTSNPKNLM